jgi:hypothetical protein
MIIARISPSGFSCHDHSIDEWLKDAAGRKCAGWPRLFGYELVSSAVMKGSQAGAITVEAVVNYYHNTAPDGSGSPAWCNLKLTRSVLISADPDENSLEPRLSLGITEHDTAVSVIDASSGSTDANRPRFANDLVFTYAEQGRVVAIGVLASLGVVDGAQPVTVGLGTYRIDSA